MGPEELSTAASAAAALDGGAPPQTRFVYALGRVAPRFPRASLEREFAQAASRLGSSAGKTDSELLHDVLSDRGNRYIARQMCWVMSVEGIETYLVVPRDPSDLDLLIATLRPRPEPTDLDCVIGVYGPLAPPEMCGLMLPIVAFDQIYSFDRAALIESIPRPEAMSAEAFAPAAAELFDRMMQVADNAGATDEHRALNYLAVRYDAVYARAADAFARNASLTSVEVVRSRLSGPRNVLDVIMSFTDRATDVTEKVFARVDVTDEFPYLVSKLAPYYDR